MTGYEPIRPAEFPWFRYEGYTFSLGLARKLPDGRTEAVFSGHSASEYDAEAGRIVVKGGMRAQTETAYRKIGTILRAAGLGPADVTRVVENVTAPGWDTYDEAEEVRREVFGPHLPAVATVAVDALLRPAALIEIEVRAVSGGGTGLHVATDRRWHRGFVMDEFWSGPLVSEPRLLDAAEAARGSRRRVTTCRDDGDLVWISGIVPSERDRFLGPVYQQGACLDVLDAVLAGLGLDASSVADLRWQITVSPGRDEFAQRLRRLWAPPAELPAMSFARSERLSAPGVFVTLDAVAARRPWRAVRPPEWTAWPAHAGSPAARVGDMVFVSGLDGHDFTTGELTHPGDVVGQAETAYRSLARLLAVEGLGPDALAETIESVAPSALADYRGVARVRERLLGADRAEGRVPAWPASTGAVCAEPVPGAEGRLFQVISTAVAS